MKRGYIVRACCVYQCWVKIRTMRTYCRIATLQWRHNDRDGVSNHQPHDCLFKRLFRRRSKKTSKLRVIGLCAGNSPGPANSPHKGPVTRKMFPFDDVIMYIRKPVNSYRSRWNIYVQYTSNAWSEPRHRIDACGATGSGGCKRMRTLTKYEFWYFSYSWRHIHVPMQKQ